MHWPDEAACAASAARAGRARPALRDAFIELHGPLGAGKTTFVRHLLRALGVEGRVKSPTYALLEPYAATPAHGGFAIAHFDFYRFDDPQRVGGRRLSRRLRRARPEARRVAGEGRRRCCRAATCA